MTYFPSVSFADNPGIDAFSRLRVSTPVTLFSVQNQYLASPLVMEPGATGTGVTPALNANTRMVLLSATAGSGTSFFQSFRYLPYQPGRSQFIAMTGVMGTGLAGAVVDAGYFDAANGIFYRQNGASGMQIVRRSSTSGSVVNEVINQADWNQDTFLGSGLNPSGITLDPTKDFILVMDLQFLAMGRVRVGFDIDGVIHWAHYFKHANIIAVPYMQTATLPVGMLLTATSTASTKNDCFFKCVSVMSEGGDSEDFQYTFAVPECTVTAGNGSAAHLLSFRPKTTFNSLVNRTDIKLNNLALTVTGANPVRWDIVIGQAITAPTWLDVNGTYSACEYTNAGTLSGSPGVVAQSGYCTSGSSFKENILRDVFTHYPITLDRAGAVRALGTVSVLVTGISGTSATRGFFNFEETR